MRVYVGVGSNLGDRHGHLAAAAERLRASPAVALVRASRVWDNAPLGPEQPRYLNAVLEIESELRPAAIHALLRLVEEAAGRVRAEPMGPRTLDLDLLLYGDESVEGPGLTVPHPRLVERRFVLQPLAELCPDRVVPGRGATVEALLRACPAHDMRPVGPYPL
ncbi:MAG TPA: 2-amino-4-hydroxy-6-hydroxymethyldihydropteridine diphosphokinase [Anaeromyxobacteraceae bacterium]|jgi:2-amino-4-hydroxy-6-hydroxymethyldihydropteridine diphosphokinase